MAFFWAFTVVCSFSPILSVVPYERIGSLWINLVLVFCEFFGLNFSTLHEAQTTTTFLSLARFQFFTIFSPLLLFWLVFVCWVCLRRFLSPLLFLILFLCFFLKLFWVFIRYFCALLLSFFFSAFPTPSCASPLSALFFLCITPPFCVLTLLPKSAHCSHLFLLLRILDPPCLSSFRVLLFPWLIESGELLLKINAPSLFEREAQEAHAKAKTNFASLPAQTCSCHDKKCR